jgi:protein TonB
MTLRILALLAIWAALATAQTGPKKVSQAEAMSAAVTKVQPPYPDLARQLNISGTVEIEVLVSESGSVESATPVSGNPVLTKPAADALRKWKFKPFLQDGTPVKAQTVLKIGFSK